MPPAGRWALGLALAFLSGVAWVALSSIAVTYPPTPMLLIESLVATSIALVVTFALALAAGFVLTRWWAALALAVAAAIGGLAGAWLVVQVSPAGAFEGLTGMGAILVVFFFFAILDLLPLTAILLAGIGMGKQRGLTLGRPHALSAGEARWDRWIAALGPVVAAALLTPQLGNVPGLIGMQAQPGDDVVSILPGILYAVVLAATCLLAGWQLRSWVGFVVAPVVYAVVAGFYGQLLGPGPTGGPAVTQAWLVAFALYILLPAAVMSAIGTAIGMYRARGAG